MTRRAWLAAALLAPAVIISTQMYFGYRMNGIPVAFAAILVIQLIHWELWVFAGPIVWKLERRWPLMPPHRTRSVIRHLAAAPVVVAAVLACFLGAYHVLIRLPIPSHWYAAMDRSLVGTATWFAVSYGHVELMLYAAIVAFAHAARSTTLLREREHQTLRLEAELTGARLATLRTQLQPHFLFNTLHTVGSLVLQGENKRAVELIAELGELLRSTLAHRDTDLAPLDEEIAQLRRYLRIEQARFRDRLSISWDVDPAAGAALVPPFILQPIVENAFRHGISRVPDEARLHIAARLDGPSLRVTIENDGPRLPEAFVHDGGNGYGLKNVTERLRTRTPAGSVALENTAAGVRATLVIPLWRHASEGQG